MKSLFPTYGFRVDRSPLRIAYFSPLPPASTGIANYSVELVEQLARSSEITLFSKQPEEADSYLRYNYNIQPISDYGKRIWDFDCAIYQIGNSLHHREIYQVALRFPGIVVLHDHGLHHFIYEISTESGGSYDYVRELAYAAGVEGADLAWQGQFEHKPMPVFELPLNDRLMECSQVIITHSDYATNAVRARFPDRFVKTIPHLVKIRTGHSQRKKLGIDDDTLIFATAGLITGDKHIDLTMRAVSQLIQNGRDVFILIIGKAMQEVNVNGLINKYDLAENTRYVGFSEKIESFFDWIATADVVVNLRHPSVGETSGSVLRALSLGRPVVVFDEGWYSELPDSLCWKVTPMDYDNLLYVMGEISNNPDQISQKGKNALKYIQESCDPEKISKQYFQTINDYLDRVNARFAGNPQAE